MEGNQQLHQPRILKTPKFSLITNNLKKQKRLQTFNYSLQNKITLTLKVRMTFPQFIQLRTISIIWKVLIKTSRTHIILKTFLTLWREVLQMNPNLTKPSRLQASKIHSKNQSLLQSINHQLRRDLKLQSLT